MVMPTGLKETSSLIVISQGLTESAVGTFTSERVALQLNPLDNEVFIIYGIDIDAEAPDLVTGIETRSLASVSTVQRTSVGAISASNVLASARIATQSDGVSSVTNEYKSDSAPGTQLEYVGILATNDFYLNILGQGNVGTKFAACRLWGVRARASSSIYAALVQSELLSQ
jgi:hypothetical protein